MDKINKLEEDINEIKIEDKNRFNLIYVLRKKIDHIEKDGVKGIKNPKLLTL